MPVKSQHTLMPIRIFKNIFYQNEAMKIVERVSGVQMVELKTQGTDCHCFSDREESPSKDKEG